MDKKSGHKLAASLLTTRSKLVTIKPEQAIGTHPDIGLGAVYMSRDSPANRADLSHENLYVSTT